MNYEEALKLDNQLCFTIYACSRAIINLYRPALDEMGITYPQYLVLLILWEEDGITVKLIGEKLFLDSGTLTPLLKRMEQAQLVVRKRSEQDERKVLIHLTEAGKEIRQLACKIPEDMMRQRGLSAAEFTSLLGDFKHLLTRLHQAAADEQ
ncbi:MAG: Organic hydroperoxide resistance transcriptional regulator [Bacilli bacterium]|nr:Organic hydroperoxide resistance transcriptional regulator [Bacilli bacterium]